MRTRRAPWRRALAALFPLALAVLAALVWWWTHPPDPARELRTRHRPLAALERTPAPDLGPGVERWLMLAADGDTVRGIWRAAAEAQPAWVVVLLGGIGTDDRAALLVPASLPVGVLAVSWPWTGPRRMSTPEFLASVPAMREALLRAPGAMARGVEAARRVCPGARVALVGASLGVAPTVAALSLARPEATVLVDGAADLPRLMRSEIARELGRGPMVRALAVAAAALGGRLLDPLEPARHGLASPATAVLLVDAEQEERYPPECVARLHATFPRATRATHPGGHVRPTHERDLAAVAEAAGRWLDALPVPR